MTKIPEFKTLDETIEFWETHDSADYWDEFETVEFEVDLYKNLLYPNLTVLADYTDKCPRCKQAIDKIVIDYVVLVDKRLLVIRDIPALQCQANKHQYILEGTLAKVEDLLTLEKTNTVQPTEMLSVPVFSLKMVA